MSLLLNGIVWGLALSILMGPILFTLVQTGIERGFRAALMIGIGVWVSDILFIGSLYSSVQYLQDITEWDGFKLYLGIIGGIILIGIGSGTLFSKPPDFEVYKKGRKKFSESYFALWLKGFLINTINPFTVLFWVGIMSTVVVKDNLNFWQASLFLGGILGTIIFTDLLKVILAKKIRKYFQPKYILLMRRISGSALVIFGIILIVRVVLDL